MACEEKEAYDSKNPARKHERTGILAERAPIEHRGCTESKQDTEKEYKYIENDKTPPDDTRIRVKDYYYGRHPKQDSQQARTKISGKRRPVLVAIHKDNHEKIRKKQQLQMFPYGFVDGTKESRDCTFAGPLVQKMTQTAQYRHDDNVWKLRLVI